MDRQHLTQLLADYIDALAHGREVSRRPEERNLYTQRLAEAAKIAAILLRSGESGQDTLLALMDAERHSIGWGYLEDAAGEEAERAFHRLDSAIPRRESAA